MGHCVELARIVAAARTRASDAGIVAVVPTMTQRETRGRLGARGDSLMREREEQEELTAPARSVSLKQISFRRPFAKTHLHLPQALLGSAGDSIPETSCPSPRLWPATLPRSRKRLNVLLGIRSAPERGHSALEVPLRQRRQVRETAPGVDVCSARGSFSRPTEWVPVNLPRTRIRFAGGVAEALRHSTSIDDSNANVSRWRQQLDRFDIAAPGASVDDISCRFLLGRRVACVTSTRIFRARERHP